MNPMSTTTAARPAIHSDLSLTRLHLLRAGYLLTGVGLALVKWPLLPDVASLPLYEGVTLCLLTAMSLLAFLGLRCPSQAAARAAVRVSLEAPLARTGCPSESKHR
jgi:hypothetical protein